jgi:hypothetical protein
MTRMFARLAGLVGFTGMLAGGTPLTAPSTAIAEEVRAKEVVAVAVRKRGFACPSPETAGRDGERSRAHHAVWVLHCANATYRVTFMLDRDARIERLDGAAARTD